METDTRKNSKSGSMQQPVRRTLQQETTAMFVSVLVLFFVFLGIMAVISGKNASDDYRRQEAKITVNNAVASLEAGMVNYNYLTRLLMTNDKVVGFLHAGDPDRNQIYEARRGIYEIQNLYSYIDSVYVFRNDGIYASTERAEYFIDMEGEEHQRILDAKGSTRYAVNGNGMVQKITGEKLLTLSRAVYDINSQKLLGMLIMNVSSRYFEEELFSHTDEKMCVLNHNGDFFCGDEELYGQIAKLRESPANLQQELPFAGGRKMVVGQSSDYPFIVVATSSKKVNILSEKIFLLLGFMVIIFLLSILAWVWFISRNVASPIRDLIHSMEKTKSSGWLEKIDTKMPVNELGELEESYNDLIEYLNELFARLLEKEENIRKAEMRVLQEQIKPHFLYNTLETLSYMAVQEKAESVHNALETLGSFYRNFLNKGNKEISLKSELKIAQDYLALQKLRYSEVFEDEYEIGPEVYDCKVPKLILQPLVENSIYHGVRLKGEKGIIRIKASRDGEALVLSVYDTGVGMTREEIEKIMEESKITPETDNIGFGLAGTLQRIHYFCDGKEEVSMTSEPGEFMEISICFPAMWRGTGSTDKSEA